MIRCRHLNPCFPHRVVQSLSMRDRRLYVFFHGCLWTGIITFAIGTGLYAAMQTYVFFIMALPCVCVMFVGQFGFRWLAVRNEDKFNMFYPADVDEDQHGVQADYVAAAAAGHQHPLQLRSAARLHGPPPPPVYSEVYDGPIFTIDGTLAPPPEYAECADSQQQQQEQQEQEQEQQQQQQELPEVTAPVPKREGEEDDGGDDPSLQRAPEVELRVD